MKWTAFYADRYYDESETIYDFSGGPLPDGAYLHRCASNTQRVRWFLWSSHNLISLQEDEVPETIKTLMLLL